MTINEVTNHLYIQENFLSNAKTKATIAYHKNLINFFTNKLIRLKRK